jgi:hypothetical protein
LAANLGFLEWRLGRRSRAEARKVVIDELERSNFEALPISELLPMLVNEPTEAGELARIIEGLSERHPEEGLYNLRTKYAFLREDFDEAVSIALQWADDEVLNPYAAGTAVYLLTDVSGDFDAASELGRRALRRTGRTRQLVNNTAYALALAGKLEDARNLLPDPGDSVFLTATHALIDILSGHINEGVAGYDRAEELASRDSTLRADLPELVRINKQLALWRAWKRGLIDVAVELKLPEDWKSRPEVALMALRAEREGLAVS